MKLKIILGLLVAALMAATYGFYLQTVDLKKEAERHRGNTEAAMMEVEHYRAFGDSIEVASVRQMELKQSEFNRLYAEQAETIKQLRQVKHPVKYMEIETVIRDTLRLPNEVKGEERRFTYDDAHLRIEGVSLPDTTILNCHQRIHLHLVEHQKRRRFLGFLWYTKKVELTKVDVWADNPKASVSKVTSVRIE